MSVEFTDNSRTVLGELQSAAALGLEICGLAAEGYAKKLAPVDTGNLRNSISHKVDPDGQIVYIGTNAEYAAYVELGTGRYAEGGRPTPWVYKDDKGNYHWTAGNPAQPYLAPAVKDHADQYRKILEQALKNG